MNGAREVLVVEDSAATRRFYADALRREGFEVREADDCAAAVAALRDGLPDVVLLDLMLPDVEGTDVALRLREVPGADEVPIIALTGAYPILDELEQFPAGVDAFLVKPIGAELLIETLREWLPTTGAPPCEGAGLVLFVEGEPVRRRLGAMHLQRAGFDVLPVARGDLALRVARERRPDCVVASATGEAGGLELCLALRHEPGLAALPVVLVSHVPDAMDEADARQVGASAFVLPGSGLERLTATVCGVLAGPPASAPSPSLAAGLRERRERRLLRQLERQSMINAALAQRCRHQARQLVMLDVVADTLVKAADVDAALRELLTRSLETSGVSKGALYRVGADGRLALADVVGLSEEEQERARDGFGQPTLLERVIGDEAALIVAPNGDAAKVALLDAAGVASALLVPLVGGGLRLGVLFLGSDLADITRQDLLTFGRALGAYLGQALALAATFSRLSEAERRNEFLGVLAHELRGPLVPIVTGVELMRRKADDPAAVARYREMIQRQTRHLTRLVDDLLDASRLTHGKLQLSRERLDLVALVREVVEDRRPTFEAGELDLMFVAPAEPVYVMGDRTRLVQVVGNLLTNAGKFTRAGGAVDVEVSVSGGERRPGEGTPSREVGSRVDDQRATIVVRDTGVGISPEVLARLFLPFSQAEQSIARSEGGLGLGLTVVRGIVELHGGAVTAASQGPGRGSTFTVTLPRAPEADADRSARAASGRLTVAAAGKVLLVEDVNDSADLLQELLEHAGYSVVVARTGPEALDAARIQLPDVIVCDIGLPGMSGYEVAVALRADPRLRRVGLVALSGYDAPEHRDRMADVGFDRRLTKPVRGDELVRAVQEVLAARRPAQDA